MILFKLRGTFKFPYTIRLTNKFIRYEAIKLIYALGIKFYILRLYTILLLIYIYTYCISTYYTTYIYLYYYLYYFVVTV